MNRYDKEMERKKKDLEELKTAVIDCYEILDRPLTKEAIVHLMDRCYRLGHEIGHLSGEKWAEQHYTEIYHG